MKPQYDKYYIFLTTACMIFSDINPYDMVNGRGDSLKKKQERIPISDMQCSTCEKKIEKSLRQIHGVERATASYSGGWVQVTYNPELVNQPMLLDVINQAGYHTAKPSASALKIIGMMIVAAAIIVCGIASDTFDLSSGLSQDMTLTALFVIGMFTSLHCAGMCGGILFSQSLAEQDGTRSSASKPSLLYNTGRILSYTFLGGLAGAIGSVFSLSLTAKAVITILAALLMIGMGLSLSGVISLRLSFSIPWPKQLKQSNRPFLIGLANGLMPCGPLQTMQLYAFGTGTFVTGALSMLAFSLGTLPLLLFLGIFTGFISKARTRTILQFSGILVIALGLTMLNRGLSLTGMNPLEAILAKPAPPLARSTTSIDKSEFTNGVQILRMSANRNGYVPQVLYVQKGIPVKWIITGDQLTSCNNEIIIPAYQIQQKLNRGETVIEFTPQTKDINFSCWMGMLRGVIKVVDTIPK